MKELDEARAKEIEGIEQFRKILTEESGQEELLFADGLDDAVIGTATRSGLGTVVAYSVQKII